MPICEVGRYQDDEDAAKNNGIEIFYRTYGHGPVKVLMIIGIVLFVVFKENNFIMILIYFSEKSWIFYGLSGD